MPEGRRLFPSLTVEENLLMGTQCGRKGPWDHCDPPAVGRPAGERRRAGATALSGGQQQMVAIGRALMTNPELLLCDEISLGLAPIVIRDVYAALPGVRAEGTTLVVVEQDINRALGIADRVYCLQEGRVTLEGRPADNTASRISSPISGLGGMDWINTIVQGALIGGLYALFAAGLSLMFGVMRLVNIAHGDLIVLAAYLALLVVVDTLGLSPFVSWSSWCRRCSCSVIFCNAGC